MHGIGYLWDTVLVSIAIRHASTEGSVSDMCGVCTELQGYVDKYVKIWRFWGNHCRVKLTFRAEDWCCTRVTLFLMALDPSWGPWCCILLGNAQDVLSCTTFGMGIALYRYGVFLIVCALWREGPCIECVLWFFNPLILWHMWTIEKSQLGQVEVYLLHLLYRVSSDLQPFYEIMSPLLNFKWVPPMFMLDCNLIFDQDQSDVIWEFTITCPNSCDLSEELEMNLFFMLVFGFLCSCDQSTSLGSWIESLPGFLTVELKPGRKIANEVTGY
jgi:hypothetical protein